jgi:hypothetical protein
MENFSYKGEIKLYNVSPFFTKFKSRVFPQPGKLFLSKKILIATFHEENENLNELKTTEIWSHKNSILKKTKIVH